MVTLTKGAKVKVDDGVRKGDVYEYLGDTRTRFRFVDTNTTSPVVNKNDLVKVTKGDHPGIYRYLGSKGSRNLTNQTYYSADGSGDWQLVDANDLGEQDFGNPLLWKLVSLSADAAEVQAVIENSQVTSAGALTLDAIASETIRSTVVAASVAIGAGGTTGVALSGAGVSTENQIRTLIKAYIDGSTGITAQRIDLTAQDSPVVKSDAGAAAVSGAVGGTAGVSLSIGVAARRQHD